jgi:type 1 glutamine amidotransferase
MPIIRYGEALNILISAKGHPYLRDPFMATFEAMDGVACTLVEQPAAAGLMTPEGLRSFDALVLYDMPGLDFRSADPPGLVEPPPSVKDGLRALLQSGKGVLALHHAIAGWPAWREYGDWLGGRFLYRPAEAQGRACPDSGYRHDVAYAAEGLAPDHPVLEGLPHRFAMTDELYLYEVFEDGKTPLLRADHGFSREGFYSAAQAVQGRMFSNDGWEHADGSDLIGWVKRALRSPLIYLQPGDGPPTYENPHYRRLLENAIRWVASPDALAWARQGDPP